MYKISWNIQFKTKDKEYKLAILSECDIISSVKNLTDIATIVLPEAVLNEALHLENKIGRGTEVLIQLGYDDKLETEFKGYIKEIINSDSSIKIICEDALFLFRKNVNDKELKPTSINKIANYLVSEIEPTYKVDCTYNINYEKFTIHDATAYDVLKKIQQETGAEIYFDTVEKTLHIHAPYLKKGGQVAYSMQKNVESSSLEFKDNLDKKVEVVIEGTDVKGNVQRVSSGTSGGDKVTIKVGTMDNASKKLRADIELIQRTAARYVGTFDTWLIPMVKPTYSAYIQDEDYPTKKAWYYVNSVTTNISESGAKRTVTLGIKLS